MIAWCIVALLLLWHLYCERGGGRAGEAPAPQVLERDKEDEIKSTHRDPIDVESAEAAKVGEAETEESSGISANKHSQNAQMLLEACAEGDVNMMQRLVRSGSVDMDARHKFNDEEAMGFGAALLSVATEHGHAEVVELLVALGADVNGKGEVSGVRPLHLAYEPSIVKILLDASADPNVAESGGITPLHGAVRVANKENVMMLLNHEAKADSATKEGQTPLHLLVIETKEDNFETAKASAYHDIAQALVRYGAQWDDTLDQLIDDEDIVSRGFRVAVHCWMDEKNRGVERLTEIPDEILQRGPNSVEQYIAALHASGKIVLRRKICVVGPSFWGKTSLVESIVEGKPLLKHPADRTIGIEQVPLSFTEKALSDQELLMEACQFGDIDVVRWLIETKRVDLHSATTKDRTDGIKRERRKEYRITMPLHCACHNRHIDLVKLLLASGVSPDVKSKTQSEMAPLHIAVLVKDLAIVQALLAAGADPNVTNGYGYSPVHLALCKGFTNGVQLLLDSGARVNTVDKTGNTPLHHCPACPEMTLAVLKAGADIGAVNHSEETPFHALISSVPSAIEQGELCSLQQAAKAMVSFGAAWDNMCDDIVKDEDEEAQAFREAVLVWMEEHVHGTELTSFPDGVFDCGPSGIREFAAGSDQRKAQTLLSTLGDEVYHESSRFSLSMPTSLAVCGRPTHIGSDARESNSGESDRVHPQTLGDTTCFERRLDVTVADEPPKAVKELDVRRCHEVTFWDFAGQEAYQVAHSAFFSKRTLYLVCVDLQAYAMALEQTAIRADKDSDVERLMKEFVDSKIQRWLRLILASQPDAEFVFVGTKADVLASTKYRIGKVHEDLKKRMMKFADSIEAISDNSKERLGRLRLHGASPVPPGTKDKDYPPDLSTSAARLRNIEWLVVNCADESSIKTARKAIEQTIIKSKRSFQMPELYSQVLDVILKRRAQLSVKRSSDQVLSTFINSCNANAVLQTNIAGHAQNLSNMACATILRTLHDIGDVLWFEDLKIDYLKKTVILHPLVLIEFVRQIVHHNHNTEVMEHKVLKEQPFWDDLHPELMLVMKQLLQRFHLVLPTGPEMIYNSDLIVPAYWRSRESALWLFLGDLLVNDPSLEKIPKDYFVQWEYHFTTSLPDVMFDELIIESYSSQYKRQAGPDWIFYRVEDEFACRVVVTRASRTLERVLRVEAIASKSATTFMWGRFEYLCESLERVVSRYKGLFATRFVVDDEGTSVGLEEFVEEWIRTPERRREPKRWVPPCLKWYYDNVMMKERVGGGK